jgi:tRNA 2-thiouridine synthesizing protein A
MTSSSATLSLDCRGRRCPLPILDLARAIATIEVGEMIAVEADDPAAAPDVAAWCRMRDHEFVGTGVAADGTPRYLVRRTH